MKVARWLVVALALLLATTVLTPSCFATPRIRFTGISVGVGYSHFSGVPFGYWGPYGYPFGYPSGYGPGFWGYDPFWSPYYGLNDITIRRMNKGEVRLNTPYPDAEVYIDGAYAGDAKKLRTIWLDPGAYDLEVRAANRESAQKRIYVLTGKTLNIRLGETHK